jgi:hypothetical protein
MERAVYATDVKELQPVPVLRLEMHRPPAKLLFMRGAEFGIVMPFIAERVRRTGRKRLIGRARGFDESLAHPRPTVLLPRG